MKVRSLAALVFLALAGCVDPPPHVILEITDPAELATEADRIALGQDLSTLQTVSLDGNDFPTRTTVSGFEAGTSVLLWVDALAGDNIVARGRVRLEFPDGESGSAQVALAVPCDEDGDEDPVVGCALPDQPGVSGVCLNGRCGESICGDGVVNDVTDPSTGAPFEECDDGNEDTTDGCPDGPAGNCQIARCGDGYIFNGVEPCDDGNLDNEDLCRSEVDSDGTRRCVTNVCGDGFVNATIDPETGDPFEPCDDGNTIDDDGCRVVTVDDSVQCVANVCGDGFVNTLVVDGVAVEECDDANTNPNDACNACVLARWNADVRFGVGDNVVRPTLQDGIPSTLSLNFVSGLARDPSGDLFISDANGNQIWRLDRDDDRVVRIAGNGARQTLRVSESERDYGDGGPAQLAGMLPRGIESDGRFLYFAHHDNEDRTPGGSDPQFPADPPDPEVVTDWNDPALRPQSNDVVFNAVRRVEIATGRIELVAGGARFGFAGDGGPASAATLNRPSDIALAPDGTLYIADTFNYRVRAVDPDGTIRTVAGSGRCDAIPAATTDALGAPLCEIRGLAVSPEGVLHLSEEEPRPSDDETAAGDRVWRLVGENLELVAGDGFRSGQSELGDGGPAVDANLFTPYGLSFDESAGTDRAGALYVADSDHHRVRRIDRSGVITTVAGEGERGRAVGDTAITSQLDRPLEVEVIDNELYIGEVDERVLRVDLAENSSAPLELVTGTPDNATLDGLVSTNFPLDIPRGSAFDGKGNLYFVDQRAARVYRINDPDGEFPTIGPVETIAGSGGISVFTHRFDPSDDGRPALEAQLNQPHDVALDIDDNGEVRFVYIADTASHRVRRVNLRAEGNLPAGSIITVAGSADPTSAFNSGIGSLEIRPNPSSPQPEVRSGSGDEPPTEDQLYLPTDVEVAPNGDVYIADYRNLRVRRLDVDTGELTTVAGDGDVVFDEDSELVPTERSVGWVAEMSMTPDGLLYFAGATEESPVRHSIWEYDTLADTLREVTHVPLQSERAVTGLAAALVDGVTTLYFAVDFDDDVNENDSIFRAVLDPAGNVVSSEPIADVDPFPPIPVDGIAALDSNFFAPNRLAADRFGNWVVVDRDLLRLRGARLDDGIVRGIAGWLFPGDGERDFASFGAPAAIAWDGVSGSWLVADQSGQPSTPPVNATLRRVDLNENRLTTVIGQSRGLTARFTDSSGLQIDLQRGFSTLGGVAVTESAWFLTESRTQLIYRVDRSDLENSTIEVFAGLGETAGSTDGGLDVATFRDPAGLATDPRTGALYVADAGNHTIRVIEGDQVRTVAGQAGLAGFGGDGLAPDEALFQNPTAVAVACDGSLYVADTGNDRVRRIDLVANTVETVIGTGESDSSGQGQRADTLSIAEPLGVAFDRFGNLFVTSTDTVRGVSAGDDATCEGGVGLATGEDTGFSVYGAPPREGYPQAFTRCLSGVAADPIRDDRLFVTDACQGFLIELIR